MASSPFGDFAGASPSSTTVSELLALSQDAGATDPASMHLDAVHQAEVASKCAAGLANHIQYLWGTVMRLQGQVHELEDWKRKALEDVRKLRDEHKMIKRRVLGEDAVPEPGSASQRSKPSSVVDIPPPGLGALPPKQESTSSVSGVSGASLLSQLSHITDIGEGNFEGVQMSTVTLDGTDFERAEWRIGQLSQKLRGCMGRALVSSPFNAAGLEELRLMVCPDGKDTSKGPRSKRQKELYAKKVIEGPLEGCLKLKVPSCPANLELQYYLKVGTSRKGPFKHNFSESTVSGCDDFGVDWLTQLEPDSSLVVSVEIVKASLQ